ncbi:outer membrane channel protein TolC [Thalassotalea aquiviva]|uniref:outer membrane channel protein TolC n=1 Tax=Thalassotalea aquiviva TaxID=3242415 RepID=UPI00352B925B
MGIKRISLILGLTFAAASQSVVAQDLKQTYELALMNDPVILQAEALVRASEEGVEQARSVLLPQLNASASYSMNERDEGRLTTDTDTLNYGIDLNMQLYHHNSWLSLNTSKKSAHLSDVNYQYLKQQLITRVSSAYFDVLAALDTLEFAEAETKAIERQLEQTKQRFSVGLTAITDVHEAQAQYDNSVAEQIAAQNRVYTAEEALREITGVYPADLNTLNTERFSPSLPTPNSPDEWQKTAEANNLQLIGQKINVDIAKDNIDIASSGHLPKVSLFGSLNASDSDIDYSNGTPSVNGYQVDSNSIGLQLNVPIYSGGNTSSIVRQAQHNYAATNQQMQQTFRSVVRDSRNSYNTVVATISGIKALEQSVLSAESALKATEAGFEVGTRTIVDVLNSTRNLYNAKRNLSTTRYQYIINMLSLKLAAGTIDESDVEAINNGLAK